METSKLRPKHGKTVLSLHDYGKQTSEPVPVGGHSVCFQFMVVWNDAMMKCGCMYLCECVSAFVSLLFPLDDILEMELLD